MSRERQIALEEESLSLGADKYWKKVDTAIEHQSEYDLKPIRHLINSTVDQLSEYIDNQRQKNVGRLTSALKLVRDMPSGLLAFVTLRTALAAVSKEQKHQAVALKLGRTIKEHMDFMAFKDQSPEVFTVTQKVLKNTKGIAQRKSVSRDAFRKASVDTEKWDSGDATKLGVWLIECLISETGLWRAPIVRKGKRTVKLLQATPELMDWIKDAHDRSSLMCPVRLPMLVPPEPWDGVYGGGYLTDLGSSTDGGRDSVLKSYNTEYLASLDQVHMPQVYAALNAVQEVPWRINTRVLDVVQKLWDEGANIEGLPQRDPTPIPQIDPKWEGKVQAWKKVDPDGYMAWAREAAATHEENGRLFSKRMAVQEKINIADKFRDEDAIYFPHTMDFRGRVYPIPHHLQPQGDDLAKGLLEFSEGKELGPDGVWWLKVHVANCFGVDKVSFDDRCEWVERNFDALLDSAIDPINGLQMWTKADDPFCALAACFDLLGYSINGPQHVSHLPIPMDGSCNGLQNFSALLRDEVGGTSTNLVPQDQPADIYTDVANLVAEKVKADAEAGDPWAIRWDGKVSRKIVKQPVMTQPYGATKNGMRKQIDDACNKHHPDLFTTSESWPGCGYLANIVYDSIGEVVIAARAAMDWLKAVSKVASNDSLPVRWTTPVGLPVLQEYRVPDAKNINVHFEGRRIQIRVARRGRKLDKRRQSNGLSPNVIHSFDASHMMRTAILAKANGIDSMAMVHDSFGTHAADTSAMQAVIRESFIEIYSQPLLERFRDELQQQFPAEVFDEIPPLPPTGNLDLQVIRDSLYFFA